MNLDRCLASIENWGLIAKRIHHGFLSSALSFCGYGTDEAPPCGSTGEVRQT